MQRIEGQLQNHSPKKCLRRSFIITLLIWEPPKFLEYHRDDAGTFDFLGPAAPVFNGEDDARSPATFGPGTDQPISMFRDGEMYWYHSDALGSIYQMTDDSQAVVRSYDYSAFGAIISESGALENPFTYTARERDEESGLYLLPGEVL